MGGTVDHREEEGGGLEVYRNIPFQAIPRGPIELLGRYPYEEYLKYADYLNRTYWNIVVCSKDKVEAVMWGHYDPLEKHMRIISLAVHKDRYGFSKDFLSFINDELKKTAQELGAERIFFESDRYKAYLRKLDGLVKLTEARVLEVY